MFISPAFAQTATQAAPEGSFLISMLPLLLIFVVFYLMVIRPQNKRLIEHRRMINELQKGDKVVTGGGLVGTVKKVVEGSDEVVIEIAEGVQVKAVRSTIMAVRDKAPASSQS